MILVDVSGYMHKALFGCTKDLKPGPDGIIHIEQYEAFFIDKFISDLIDEQLKYQNYGELVLCFDYKGYDKYWRCDIHPEYKGQRKAEREKSVIDFGELYNTFGTLKTQLEENTPWKCVTADRAEADDTILILAREYNKVEPVLILSADKDMIQAQIDSNVKQYSFTTNKWLVPEDKYRDMEHWRHEHVCLGDISDNVFTVVHETVFSDNFIKFLKEKNIPEVFHEPHIFKDGYIENNNLIELENSEKAKLKDFNIYRKNRKGEDTELDVYKKLRFGPSTLQKNIDKFGSLDKFLDSHVSYRKNYDKNKILVLEEYIPDYIKQNTLLAYSEAKTEYNKVFNDYLMEHNLVVLISDLQKVFKNTEELSVENCNWDM